MSIEKYFFGRGSGRMEADTAMEYMKQHAFLVMAISAFFRFDPRPNAVAFERAV